MVAIQAMIMHLSPLFKKETHVTGLYSNPSKNKNMEGKKKNTRKTRKKKKGIVGFSQ